MRAGIPTPRFGMHAPLRRVVAPEAHAAPALPAAQAEESPTVDRSHLLAGSHGLVTRHVHRSPADTVPGCRPAWEAVGGDSEPDATVGPHGEPLRQRFTGKVPASPPTGFRDEAERAFHRRPGRGTGRAASTRDSRSPPSGGPPRGRPPVSSSRCVIGGALQEALRPVSRQDCPGTMMMREASA